MPETPWGPDVLPHPLVEFAAPASAVAWGLNDTGPVSMAPAFATVPSAWALIFWGGPTTMLFAAGAASARRRMMTGMGM